MEFLKSKFKECQESHQTCRQRSESTQGQLPSRLLEIGGINNDTVNLRSRDEVTSSVYFTISHCWGNKIPMQLTAETEAFLRAGISISNLPKTFRDAIFVASQFSAPYVWIDSLCVFQDNLKDWHMEAATMCDVYSSALCNIAATGASDGSVGLFYDRIPVSECSFQVCLNLSLERLGVDENIVNATGVYEVLPCDQWKNSVEEGPLNKRAWVMQERFLSTRVLHFSASQLFWECLENRACESFPRVIPRVAEPVWMFDSQLLKRTIFKNTKGREMGDRPVCGLANTG
jgi:hypothetical protein